MKKTVFILVFAVMLSFLCSCSKKEDMTYLEFPETAWGMNVEEALDAYGITKEDMCLYNETDGGASFVIEDFELFGERTSKIIFQFLDFDGNGNRMLYGVQVNYPESADMNHVLKKMQNVYGETGLDEKNWDTFSQNSRLVTVFWWNNEEVKALEFNAYNLAVYNELKSQLSEQQ